MDNQTGHTKVDVGTPPSGFQPWELAEVHFHGFKDLPTENDTEVESPVFTCLGHQWCLIVFPGGEEDSDDGMVAAYLTNMSGEKVDISQVFSVRASSMREVAFGEVQNVRGYGVLNSSDMDCYNCWGEQDFAKRSTLLKALVNGTLTIQVWMKMHDSSNQSVAPYIPANPIRKNIFQLFLDEDSADVVFEVSRESNDKRGRKRNREQACTGTTFHAHRAILHDGAPQLAELCKLSGEGDPPRITLTDVEPDIFRHMLYYVYGGKLSDEDLGENAKELIDAADKYGIVNLKLQAEASYVKSTEFTNDTIVDNLLYSYSKNCALLKEAVMDFIVDNKGTIMGEVSFDDCPGSAVTDVLVAVARGEKKGDGGSDVSNFNNMRVATLRRMLDEKGLDVDGSREAMVALLKENS